MGRARRARAANAMGQGNANTASPRKIASPIFATASSVSIKNGILKLFFAVIALFTKPGRTLVTYTWVDFKSTRSPSRNVAK